MTTIDICEISTYNVNVDSERSLLMIHMMSSLQLKLHTIDTTCTSKYIFNDGVQKIELISRNANIFAIKDHKYTNKFLIIYTIIDGRINEHLFGFVVYFDESGEVYDKKIITSSIAEYDSRNVRPNHNNLYLHDDKLIFLFIHRDTKTFFMKLVQFSPTTNSNKINIIFKSAMYCSSYGGTIIPTNNHKYIVTEANIGWQHENQSDDKFQKYIIYDITSIALLNDTKAMFERHFTDDYKLITDIITFKDEDEISSFEGYPIKCIKCNNKTAIASANYNVDKYGHNFASFGNSFCVNCMIKYSCKNWNCCKALISSCFSAKQDITICEHILTEENNYECNKEHVNISITFDTEQTYIPPYLLRGVVTYGKYKYC